MKSNRRSLWLVGIGILILAALILQTQSALSQSETPQVFLPLIRKDATQTPTPTDTATPTATATSTNTPTPTNTPTITPTPTFPPVAWLPYIQRGLPPAPQYVTSYYIQNIDPSAIYNLGCSLGVRDSNLPGKQDSLVILDFRQMWIDNGVYGIVFWDPALSNWHNVPFSEVESTVKQYVLGYWACSQSDNESQVTVGIGVNSYGNYGTGTYDTNALKPYARSFGEKLATSVYTLTTWAIQKGYQSQVTITGAIDIEWDCASTPKWNHPDVVYEWVDGYTSKATHNEMYINFGACVGCPISYSPTWKYNCYYKDQPWSQDRVWWVSEGAPPAMAVPEIYRNDGYLAKQWQAVSLFGANKHLIPIEFWGAMTQWQACQQRPEPECTYTDGSGLDNTPEEGWQQLYIEINKNPLTAQSILRWVTDIRWQ